MHVSSINGTQHTSNYVHGHLINVVPTKTTKTRHADIYYHSINNISNSVAPNEMFSIELDCLERWPQ